MDGVLEKTSTVAVESATVMNGTCQPINEMGIRNVALLLCSCHATASFHVSCT